MATVSGNKEVVGVVLCGNYFLVTDTGLAHNILQYDCLITSERIEGEDGIPKRNKVIPIKESEPNIYYKGWKISKILIIGDSYNFLCYDKNNINIDVWGYTSNTFRDSIQKVLDHFVEIVENNYSADFYYFMNSILSINYGFGMFVSSVNTKTELFLSITEALSSDNSLSETKKIYYNTALQKRMTEHLLNCSSILSDFFMNNSSLNNIDYDRRRGNVSPDE